MRLTRALAALLLLAAVALALYAWREWRASPLPGELRGTLVFVSDREGRDSLYVRTLPQGSERRLTVEAEPVSEPALSPEGSRIAFVVGGRIGLAALARDEVRLVTLGIDWKDASPAWLPDGRGLVVAARRSFGEKADLHLLSFAGDPAPGRVERRLLTTTRAFDESSPVVTPDGTAIVFLRGDHLFRLERQDLRVKRLTGGFRRYRSACLLPSGRLLALWSEAKQFGLELMDPDGGRRETFGQGSVFYRNVAASPDGRYLAATFSFDLGFHPFDALRPQTEELHLLDARGAKLGVLARSWRHSFHSPAWGG